MIELIQQSISSIWPILLVIIHFAVAMPAAIHAIMTKTQVQSAVGWTGIILLSPYLGSALYFCLGINRISRRWSKISQTNYERATEYFKSHPSRYLKQSSFDTRLADKISPFPMLDGNSISILHGGATAYPAMLDAIKNANTTITLQSYIFDSGKIGDQFISALSAAKDRGVDVRVLIDGVGAAYSKTSVIKQLKSLGITSALFMDKFYGITLPYANLRNHRKVLIIDGKIAFTGGMNIRDQFALDVNAKDFALDTHFRVSGPVVPHFMALFAQDWDFATREGLAHKYWQNGIAYTPDNTIEPLQSQASMRLIPSEPHENGHINLLVISDAITRAQKRVIIQSPYFVPPLEITGALRLAGLRGVEVDVILPGQSNLFFVDCAAKAQLNPLLQSGCRLWYSAPPFDHSKLMIIDDTYAYVGSTNMDTRSLRLNFELDLEVYDQTLVSQIAASMKNKINTSQAITHALIEAQPFWRRLFNRIIWLGSPYL